MPRVFPDVESNQIEPNVIGLGRDQRRKSIGVLEENLAAKLLDSHSLMAQQAAGLIANGSGGSGRNIEDRGQASLTPKSLRLGLATTNPFVIDSKDTISSYVFGHKFSNICFALLRNLSVPIFILTVIGSVFCVLTLLGYVPTECAYIGTGILPGILLMSSTFNIKICKRIFISFDAYLMIGYATVMMGGIFYAVRKDERRIVCLAGLMIFYFAVFIDALPAGARRYVGRSGMFFCWMCTACIVIMLYRNKIPDVDPGSWRFGDTEHTSLSMALSAAMQYMLFTAKVVCKAIIFPKRFFLITSQLKSVKVDAEDADVLRGTATKIAREETLIGDMSESFRNQSLLLKQSFGSGEFDGSGEKVENIISGNILGGIISLHSPTTPKTEPGSRKYTKGGVDNLPV